MPYETARLLAYQTYQQWISKEFLSTGWFVMVAVLAVTYAIWLKLVDTRRLRDLLLIGCLCAVGFSVADIILIGYFGVADYNISLGPGRPPVFVLSLTVGPILFMLIQQYTFSWKEYLLWTVIGSAAAAFGLMPLYVFLGIITFYKWNYFYHFFYMLTAGIVSRALLLWIISLEQSHLALSREDSAFSGLQPAASKPIHDNSEGNTDND